VRRLVFLVSVAAWLWLAPGAFAAGWCGTGETATERPDAVTGQQIHAVVVTPSDGPDNFAADANLLSDDVASLSAWWTGQDPTRVPRFDMTAFPGGTCLDISFLRLPDATAAFQGASLSFGLVLRDLQTAGFFSPHKDYYVYFDGPSVQADVCGTGAGSFDTGQAYAVVWLAGCPGVPTDTVAAHELLHALGALPVGAPHACPGDPGHPCDSQTDLLYPYTTGSPLSQEVLDYGHDDYYGHNGTWPDMQDSVFLHHLDTPEVALALVLSGTGSVKSTVPGVDCSASCTTQWDQGSAVTLTATPSAGARFVRWTGACSGRVGCTLVLSQSASASAVFGPTTIPVRVTAAGKGRVVCSPRCSSRFTAGTPLLLRAVAASGWRFAGWSGACKGARPTCSPTTDFAVSARATFKKKR